MSERDVEALAGALCQGDGQVYCINWDPDVEGGCTVCVDFAAHLIASGAVISPETLDERVREAVEAALAPIEALLVDAEAGADAWGTCTGEWLRIDQLRSAVEAARIARTGSAS